ncbi:MAG: hypothetical protein FWE67_10455, partial [Planctomycetaceae bacterium]|nr:hypothetical protein [Planctomycetaceae bacterium]
MYRLLLLAFLFTFPLLAEEQIGVRPYEMERAGRTADVRPPLIDFENLDNWTVETVESEAAFTVSREQQLWNKHVGKLTYKSTATDSKKPVITLKPPKPIPIPQPFDCVNLWIYGNNWTRPVPDPSTPQVVVTLILRGSTKQPLRVELCKVNWKEWHLLHKKLSAEQLASLGDAPVFEAVEISGGTNTESRNLFFDNLSFFKEELPPLTFEPRPLRNVKLPEGQTTGTNTGPGTLPFPNREETILPTSTSHFAKQQQHPWTYQYPSSYYLSYLEKGDDHYDWYYTPKTGTLDDFTVKVSEPPINGSRPAGWEPKNVILQIKGSGIRFVDEPKEPPQLLSIAIEGEVLIARWKFGNNEVEYHFTMKNKTLIVDVRCPGGNVKEFSSGGWNGFTKAKLVKVPYLVGNGTVRPAVIVAETYSDLHPVFILSTLDHTRSNSSMFFWENKAAQNYIPTESIDTAKDLFLLVNKMERDYISAAACSRYLPKTDGKRNDCFERLFITVSRDFEEVLPNIPNDPSPWRHVTAEYVWRTHGVRNHDSDYEYWKRIKRYGLEKILVTDHETVWRDGYESFTFRTSAAPKRGGDEGLKEYTQKMHALGFKYGPYNNYVDFAPVNEFWNPDWVTRQSDGSYRSAWMRCYNVKPAIAVQMEPKITEIVQQKFGFNTAYCDVHTSPPPWGYVDYDARVPGAGTFAATFFAYGELLLHQKKIWNGPVYSEGPYQMYYSGLTDGNYAQDQAYFVSEKDLPWIVDFDLLKIHPLENNFGMGGPVMFYGAKQFQSIKENIKERKQPLDKFLAAALADTALEFSGDSGPALDRFLAATLAFGHTGYFAFGQLGNIFADFELEDGVRSYFAVQQLAARYGKANVKKIRYADENGEFLT